MCDECERRADEFAAWCREKFLESDGIIACVAGVDQEGGPSSIHILAPTMDMSQLMEFLKIAAMPAIDDYVSPGETLQ